MVVLNHWVAVLFLNEILSGCCVTVLAGVVEWCALILVATVRLAVRLRAQELNKLQAASVCSQVKRSDRVF